MNGYMKYTALVPVKSLVTAKSRLVPDLPPNRREMLVLDMLYHVLRVLQDSKLFERVSVVSPDARVLEQARAGVARALIVERPGHNPALYAAALRETSGGPSPLLTTSAHLPLLPTHHTLNLLAQS